MGEEGLRHLQEAVALGPRSFTARYNLGMTLLRLGKTPEGIDHLSAAARLDPEFAEAHYWLGVACSKERRYEEACAHFSDAMRLDPRRAESPADLNGLAMACCAAGKPSQAISVAEKALRLAEAAGDTVHAEESRKIIALCRRHGGRRSPDENGSRSRR